MWRIRTFFRKIKNLWRWFPIIWKDEDFDQRYIYDILKFKLKNQAKYIGGKDRHTRAKRDAELMNLCVRLIDKITEEYYVMEYFDYEDSNIRFEPTSQPDRFEIKIDYKSEILDEYFKKYPKIYKKVITKHNLVDNNPDTKHRIAMLIGHYNHERAHKLLFKIIEQNIQGWWD